MPARDVRPKPYQQPHPPIWVAALQPTTYRLAAQKGIGVMALSVAAPRHTGRPREGIQGKRSPGESVGRAVNDQWLSSTMAFCGEDNGAARELAAQSLRRSSARTVRT